MNAFDADYIDPGDRFLQRVRRAAVTVLGDSPAGRDVAGLCADHLRTRQSIMQDRAVGSTIVAIVGAAGQGKSWLAKQLVAGTAAEQAIPSGNREDESTRRLIWIGPQAPRDLDSRREQFLHCDAGAMRDLGGPYLLVDTPGATDDDKEIAETARRALSLAAILVMVVRRDQLRSQTVSVLSTLGEGTLVVPVINAVRDSADPELAADADTLVARMRAAAPSGTILSPILIPDFDVQDLEESAVAEAALKQLKNLLSPYLDGHLTDDRRRRIRLAAVDARFRESLRATLGEHLPGLTRAVDRLNEEARKLPGDVALSMVGGHEALRAGIRSKLRLSVLTDTAAVWFPYRSLLGLLNLTHGAWDRVVLSLSGSLPSLISVAWTSARNLRHGEEVEQDLREGLRRRSSAAVVDRLGPPIARFHEQLREMLSAVPQDNEHSAELDDDRHPQMAYLAGIDALQEESQRIFDEEVQRRAVPATTAVALAVLGTLIFWALMAAPIYSLYDQYVVASYQTFRDSDGSLERFPRPEFSMLLTSLLLSLLPTALYAMLVITYSQRRRTVDRIEQRIRQRHAETIARLQQDGVLRLRWTDPLLGDAEFLLSAGRE
ncbi:hypothetical protein [Roseimaritima sediminicola]|uniref:hypothetical protein n=1 Tax=Roseimaritima sediminicola TaxID=2662066 RepID=UPI0012983E78|nr:hypothetical protein [Roseimaritima sediminicola]